MSFRFGKPALPRKSDPPEAPRLRGNVDRLDALCVHGWGVGVDGAPVDVSLTVGGRPVPFALQRHDRPDVRASIRGLKNRRIGFAAELEPSFWRQPGASGAQELDLVVSLGGQPFPRVVAVGPQAIDDWWRALTVAAPSAERERQTLRLLAHVAAAGGTAALAQDVGEAVQRDACLRGLDGALADGDAGGAIARARRQQVHLERVDGLEIEGWAYDPQREPQEIRLHCNGHPVPGASVRLMRDDVRAAVGASHAALGLRVLPSPAIWDFADADGRCALACHVQGHSLFDAPLVVDAAVVQALWAGLQAKAAGEAVRGGPQAQMRRVVQLEAHGPALAARGWLPGFDAEVLARVALALDPQAVRLRPPRGDASADHQVRAAVEVAADLMIAGWVRDGAEGGELLRLQSNGRDVDCVVLRSHRADVQAAIGALDPWLGFEIQLPPEIWRHADAGGACAVTLLVNGHPLDAAATRLDMAGLEAIVLRALDPAATPRAGEQSWHVQLRRLLVLEHVHASGRGESLGAAAQALLKEAGLREIGARNSATLLRLREADIRFERTERATASTRRRVWRLQRRFNALVDRGRASGATAAQALATILEDPDAVDGVRSELLLSLVPTLCDDPAFEALAQALPTDEVGAHAAGGDNWYRCLYLACLARDGRIEEAAQVLDDIAGAPARGWLDTGCVAFALRVGFEPGRALRWPDASAAAQDDPAPDEATRARRARRRLAAALLRLLREMPGDAWSRLHDHRLVDASATLAATLTADPALLGWSAWRTEAALRDILAGHGLAPHFWRRLAATIPMPPVDATLRRAQADFEALDAFVAAPALAEVDWRDLVERLRVQHAQGQRDAAQVLRELVQWRLGRSRARGLADDPDDRYVLEALAPTDPWRADAWPLPGAGTAPAAASLWPTDAAPIPPADVVDEADADDDGRDATPRPDNRLELLSPVARVAALADAALLVVCVVRNERVMLPHFLAHHRRLGATHFVFVDNGSDDGTRETLLAQPDVVLYGAATDYRDSHFGVSWQQAVLGAHALGRWALLADADEFLLYRDWEATPLPALVDRLAAAGHDAAQVLMLDMYPRGALRDTDFAAVAPMAGADWFDREPLLPWHLGAGLYSNTPTWLSALRHRLIPHSPPNAFTAQKTALLRYRPAMRLSEGLHYAAGVRPAPDPLFFGHYKYHAGFREKVLQEIERKQHFDGASEYAHYLAMIAEPDASLFDAELSVQLADSAGLPGGGIPR